MGLSESRKRTKISHDPRNTNWSKSTDTFGHKILTAQGWTPGSFLGAQDAPHVGLYTEANASHIRLAMKDDNLGVGARASRQAEGECVGLDAFQGLLGRLNGKTDQELEKEEQSRNDVKRVLYAERRWGGVRFVKGGLLIGDKIEAASNQNLELMETRKISPLVKISEKGAISKSQPSKKKKRKILGVQSEDITSGRQSSRATVLQGDLENEHKSEEEKHPSPSAPSPKRKIKEQKRRSATTGPIGDSSNNSFTKVKSSSHEDLEKAKRKSERHRRREEKRQRREHRNAVDVDKMPNASIDHVRASAETNVEESKTAIIMEEKSDAAPQQPSSRGGRHSVRQRYIQHKKMAIMDSKALSEIFMIKA